MHGSISTNCCRRGLTLIEVVAGLALMGTLVAAMLSAKSRFTGQYHYAQRVLTAVDAMDALLVNRWPTISAIEDSESGDFDDQEGLMWRAAVVDDQAAADWHCRVMRVDVLDSLSEPGDPPLATVDLLVPELPEDLPQNVGPEEVPDSQDPEAVGAEQSSFDEIRPDAAQDEQPIFHEADPSSGELNRPIQVESESSGSGEAP